MKQSYWLDSVERKSYPKLNQSLTTDVVVVGGGITGISTALELAEANLNVILVEANQLMNDTTGHTTAKVTIQHNLIYDKLIKKHGFEKAKAYKEANECALEHIKSNIETYHIDCDYQELPAYVYTNSPFYVNKIEAEYKAAMELGIDAFVSTDLNLPFPIKLALGFNNQAQFHVAKYLNGLIKELQRLHVNIYEQTRVTHVNEENDMCEVHTDSGHTLYAKQVVVASHYPHHKHADLYFTKLIPTFSYIVAAKTKVPLPHGHMISAENPVRSLRTQMINGEEVILFAGESHQATQLNDATKHYEALIDFAKEHFELEKVLYQWSNQDYKTTDHLPYIGRINQSSKNIFVATGFYKWGMTQGVMSSLILKDLIVNGQSVYEDVFHPCRIKSIQSATFWKYNLKMPFKLIGTKIGQFKSDLSTKPGQGKLVLINNKKYGVYHREDGHQLYVDLTCPHMKCTLRFNQAEKTYDCPCHGSRFSYDGVLIDGPTKRNLKKYRLVFQDGKKELIEEQD
jgi:glycine/D-amino acid oxidase-like deaminating enzyme/nitrite reductase/ring-hydroxylating ferredoxin subunit